MASFFHIGNGFQLLLVTPVVAKSVILFFFFSNCRWQICRHRQNRIPIAEVSKNVEITFPLSVAFICFCQRNRAWECDSRVPPPLPIGIHNFEDVSARPRHSPATTPKSQRSNLGTTFAPPALRSGNQFRAIRAQMCEFDLHHSRSNLGTNFAPFALRSGNQCCIAIRLVNLPNSFSFCQRAPCAQTHFIFDGVGSWAGGGIILHGGLPLPRGTRSTAKISADE